MTGCGHASTPQDLFPKDSNVKDFPEWDGLTWIGWWFTWIGWFASDFGTFFETFGLQNEFQIKCLFWKLVETLGFESALMVVTLNLLTNARLHF